jgi:hypothetical protein
VKSITAPVLEVAAIDAQTQFLLQTQKGFQE